MKQEYTFFKNCIAIFILLGILFIPFPFHLLDIQAPVTDFIFGGLIHLVSAGVFGISLTSTRVHSDSVSMYILVLLLFVLSVLIVLLLQKIRSWKKYRPRFLTVISSIGYYYLFVILLKYGLDKIFKAQFYMPEPNTLYTPIGQVDKDLLYWTTMGTSHSYNVFLGIIEVIAAFLLLAKNARLAGLLLALVSLVQVVAVNFSFDISVKLYSLFLLFITLYLLVPWRHRLYSVLFTQKEIPAVQQNASVSFIKHPLLSVFVKCMIIGLVYFEALYPTLKSGNFNDDKAKRPYLHGAYEVKQVIAGTDTLAEINYPAKRVFIHRSGYLIFQNSEDQMQDFALIYDTMNHLLVLNDYQLRKTVIKYSYNDIDSTLTLRYFNKDCLYTLNGKAIDWKKLPVLKDQFHWAADLP